jgi:hypothetical protein
MGALVAGWVVPVGGEEPPEVGVADSPEQVLERVFEESQVSTRPEEVSAFLYLGHLLREIGFWMARGVSAALPSGSFLLWLPRLLLLTLLVGVALLLVLWLVKLPSRPSAPEEMAAARIGEVAAPERAGDLGAWVRALEERLKAGPPRAAAEALWWWVARSLRGGEVVESWTGGDLLRASGRRELAPYLGALDAFLYGPRNPELSDVRELAGTLRRVVSDSLEARP